MEQLRLIYAAVPVSLIAILVNSTVLSVVLWHQVPVWVNLAWLGAIYVATLFRFLFYRRFSATPAIRQSDPVWRRLAYAAVLSSALLWGLAGVVLFPSESQTHQVFLAFVIAGMCAGAVTTLSAINLLSSAFVLVSLLPMIGRFILAGDPISQVMGMMTTLFLVMLVLSSRRLYQTILETLQTRAEYRTAEQTIRYQAMYDELTDLPNRRMLLDRLNQEMARSRRHGHFGAILFIDIDHFKTVNDSLGHRVGDRLLQAVALRIRERLRDEDTAARLGGDEFVVLMPEIANESFIAASSTKQIADELLALFRQPFSVDGHELHLTASIGVALFPLDQHRPEELLQRADVAMYSAKEKGRDNTQVFLPSMQQLVDRRLEIEKGLRQALGGDELELYYQPQVDSSGAIIGAEALLRWNHPEKGLVMPGAFIAIAEETGLIHALGDWVIRRACCQLKAMGRQSDFHVSVNISPRQFREAGFVQRVRSILEETGVSPHLLRLELTESVVIDNVELTIDTMQALKSMGISFSIDDFGTGHSSLAYLKRLPLDELKIDQSFVRDIHSDVNDAVIVETIILMSRALGLEVIAEGVEERQSQRFLEEKGCHRFQGYLYSPALPLGDFLCLLQGPLQIRRA